MHADMTHTGIRCIQRLALHMQANFVYICLHRWQGVVMSVKLYSSTV